MTPQQLKNSILQLAIQGKLVEQRSEEGTGQDLFNQIQEEKQKLIVEGKIKKEKALAPITEDEIPFDIPESWRWTRVKDVVFNHGQKTPTNKFVYIEINSIDNKNNRLSDHENILVPEKAPSRARKIVNKGDVIYSMVRPYLHNVCVIDRDFSHESIASTGFAVMSCFYGLNNYFLFYYLISPSFDEYATSNNNSKGTAYPAINDANFYKALFPLPPLEEQKRIVAKIEELLTYVDKYQEYYDELESLNSKFPGQLRKSILQYAIEGKLVEQRPEEGTGQELFNQIQEEKQNLITQGKIKKEKALASISDEEIPFDIPNNWSWVRIGELGVYKKGPFGSALTKSLFVAKGTDTIKVYEQKNAIRKDASLGEYYITKEYFENKMTSFEVFPRDVIVSCAGTIGEIYQLPDKIEKGIINQALMRIHLMPSMRYDFYSLIFDFLIKDYSQKDGNGSAIKNIPPFADFKNYLVPLPPLEEQKRIVAKVEELFKLCDKLDLS